MIFDIYATYFSTPDLEEVGGDGHSPCVCRRCPHEVEGRGTCTLLQVGGFWGACDGHEEGKR